LDSLLGDMNRSSPSVRTAIAVPAGALRAEYPGVNDNDDIYG
jgi:hypothetical protein